MMKRLLLPGYLFFFLCICAAMPANAQDSLKKAEPEKKIEPEKKAVAKTVTPPKAKPVYQYHKVAPLVTTAAPPATKVNNDTSKTQIDPTQLNDKSLNGQYQYLLSKTYHYQQPLIAALWKNAMDTLNLERRQLKDIQARLAIQNKTLDTLKADVTANKQSLSESTEKVDSISVFGMLMTKSTYNLVMFGAVGVLALALFIVIVTTAKYKHEAKYRIELYEEIEEEYKTFKAKANEKELKLARELQTERNKLDELLGRG